jgi:hypothetical protein
MSTIFPSNLFNQNQSTLIVLALIFSLPYWELLQAYELIRFEVAAALLVLGYYLYVYRWHCVRKSSVIFFFIVLILVVLGHYPPSALIIPSGLILGEFLTSLNINWKYIDKSLLVVIIVFMGIYGFINNLDPNFLSFYIACILVCGEWTGNKRKLIYNTLYIMICFIVVLIFKSRAFAYASIILFLAPIFNRLLNKFNLLAVMTIFFVSSVLITFGITFKDGGVVKLYRSGSNQQSEISIKQPQAPVEQPQAPVEQPQAPVEQLKEPSFLEKVSNISDANRFRMSRLWIEEYIINNSANFFFGMGENYPRIVREQRYFPAHNSFIEMAIYFGIPYLFAFLLCLSNGLSKINFKKYSLFYLLSFGMVLHGIFYIGLLPFYFVLCKIYENKK